MNENTLFLFFFTIQAGISAWQHVKIESLKTKVKNLCKDCVYDFTPRNKEKPESLANSTK